MKLIDSLCRCPPCDPPRVEFTFDTYTNGSELISAVESLNYKGGNTRTGSGLKFVADNFFSPPTVRNIPKVRGGRVSGAALGVASAARVT